MTVTGETGTLRRAGGSDEALCTTVFVPADFTVVLRRAAGRHRGHRLLLFTCQQRASAGGCDMQEVHALCLSPLYSSKQ